MDSSSSLNTAKLSQLQQALLVLTSLPRFRCINPVTFPTYFLHVYSLMGIVEKVRSCTNTHHKHCNAAHFGESQSGSFQANGSLSSGSSDAELQRVSGSHCWAVYLNAEECVGARMWASGQLLLLLLLLYLKKVRLLKGILRAAIYTGWILGSDLADTALLCSSCWQHHISSLKTVQYSRFNFQIYNILITRRSWRQMCSSAVMFNLSYRNNYYCK